MISFGFCYWDLPAALLLVTVLVIYLVRRHRLVKTCAFYEEELQKLKAEKNNTQDSGKHKNQAYIDGLSENGKMEE